MSSKDQVIETIKENLATAKMQLAMSEGSLISHNYVIAFPDTLLTIKCGDNGKGVINNGVIAAQYKKEKAELYATFFKNGAGESPIAMHYRAYYMRLISDLEELLTIFS